MKTLTLSAFLFLLTIARGVAEEPADGLFAISDLPDARKVTAADGSEVRVGARLKYEIQEARLTAGDNGNETFSLWLRFPFVEKLDEVRHVLVVKGKAYGQSSSGSDAGETSDLGFQIAGKANAEAVAAYFRIKPTCRAHPGHRLAVSFVPAQKEFAAEGPVPVTLRIENVGDKPVYFEVGGRNRAARDNQFVFRASDGDKALPDIGTDLHFGGLSVIHELKPGEVFEKEVDLAKWYAFGKAGVYDVHGSYHLDFFESKAFTQPVWEDWATADFTVRIAEKAK